MTAVGQAFMAWSASVLAAHQADGCPDDIMDGLVEASSLRYHELATMPAQTCCELVLKLFPLMLDQFEPEVGEDPLVPTLVSGATKRDLDAFGTILADMRRLVPAIDKALNSEGRRQEPLA